MSSNSSACQGLQSCLDPLSHEPRVLMHHFVPSKLDLSSPLPHNQIPIPQTLNPKNHHIEKDYGSNTDCDKSWNFIQSLTNSSHNCTKLTSNPEQQVYVHPLDKRSSCSLSSRSLEMCTESLGCETGSGIDLNMDEFDTLLTQKQSSCIEKKRRTEKVKHSSSFPPPLTSISGSEGVQVQTHREGGRLVIKAFSIPSRSSCFQAERENGRLRISLRKTENQEIEEEERKSDELDKSYYEEADAVVEADAKSDFNECLRGEHIKENEEENERKFGGDWGIIRCNGERSGSKRMPSLQYCVAIS